MSKGCCVCGETKEYPDNRLFTCKGHGCDVTVHQGCYGIVTLPTGLWFCRKCESQERAARVRCDLCPKKEGALKRTDSGSWAHVVCALYIPEVVFGNNRKMEPIITSKLPRERFTKSCYICEERGLETQATYGACMACHKSSCRQAFHVTCAQKENLLCEEEDPRDPRNVVYCGYCSTHYKKMMRQKYKQTLRKQSVTPTASTAPPFPPSSPTGPLPTTSSSTSVSAHPSSLPGATPLHGSKDGRVDPSHHTVKPTKREKSSSGECPQKRLSTDNPLPQSKRKRRMRKLSSSNESTTSEAPSNSSDHQAMLPPTSNLLGSPSSFVHSPPSIVVGGVGAIPTTSLLLSSVSKEPPHFKSEVVEGESDVVSKMHADMLGAGPLSPIQVGGGRRQPGSSTSSDNSNRSQAPPPRSLQELLERQWEQTAQFILDQAGKQNNAGSMLAHLHELQSENRSMQSRIMELASQREFYIAINTKLHQTLAEHNLGRLPNGVQPIATGGGAGGSGVVGGDGLHPQQSQPQAMAAISSGPALPHSGERGSSGGSGGGNIYEEDSRMQEDGVVLENEGSGLLMDTDNGDDRMSVSSTALPKEDQDTLLQAHFSPLQRTTGGGRRRMKSNSSSSGGGTGSKHCGLQEGLVDADPMLSSVAEPPSQQRGAGGGGGGGGGGNIGGSGSRGYGGGQGHPRHLHNQMNSNNMVSPFSLGHHTATGGNGGGGPGVAGGHSGQHHHNRHPHDRHTNLLSSSQSSSSQQVLAVENSSNDRLAAPPSNEGGTPSSLNEVTHVTAAVQRPIASFGSIPNDTSPMLSSAVGHPQVGGGNSNVYFNSPSS